jgi:hypothetical protein
MEEEEIGNDGLFSAALKRAVSNSVNDLRREAVYAARQDAADVNQFGGTGTTFEDAAMAALAAPFRFVKNAATETFDSIGRVGRDVVSGAAAVATNNPTLATKQASGADVLTTLDLLLSLGSLAGMGYAAKKGARYIQDVDPDISILDTPRKRALIGKNAATNQYGVNAAEIARRINALANSGVTKKEILNRVRDVKKIEPRISKWDAMGREMGLSLGKYKPRDIDLRYSDPSEAISHPPAVTIRTEIPLEEVSNTALHEYTHALDLANSILELRFRDTPAGKRAVWEQNTPSISQQINNANPSLLPSVDDIEKSLIERFLFLNKEISPYRLNAIRKDADYLGNPVEQFARINQMRHMINEPSNLYRQISKEQVLEQLKKFRQQNDMTDYFNSMSPEKITELLNKLPAVAGATTVANAQFRNDQ